jgi:diadenosine tetraphosphatase ApaH/serine/threonine PP2A family protein phosphatase
MRSRHVETKSALILCPTVSDPGKYVCVHDHLLQLMDQLLDLGLGAKSWPAVCLHPVHRAGDCDLWQGGDKADAAVPRASVLAPTWPSEDLLSLLA